MKIDAAVLLSPETAQLLDRALICGESLPGAMVANVWCVCAAKQREERDAKAGDPRRLLICYAPVFPPLC